VHSHTDRTYIETATLVEVAATSHSRGLHELLYLRCHGQHDAILAPAFARVP
jgi:hypothetical protein